MKIKNDQLELGLQNQIVCRSIGRRARRLSRAALWFDRMRQVVEEAADPVPAPSPRSEALWIVSR